MRSAAVLATLICVLAAGCGGGDKDKTTSTRGYQAPRGYTPAGSTRGPVVVAQAYVDAFGAGDYSAACNLISKNTKIEVTQNGTLKCETVFAKGGTGQAKSFFSGAKVSDAKVKGDNATVTVTPRKGTAIQLPLVHEDGQWKVSR